MRDELQGMFKWFVLVSFGISLFVQLTNLHSLLQIFNGAVTVMSPFLYGAGIAYLVDVLVKWIMKRWLKQRRLLAIVISYGILIQVMVQITYQVIPQQIASIIGILNNFDYYLQSIDQYLNNKIGTDISITSMIMQENDTINQLIQSLIEKHQQEMFMTGSQIIQNIVKVLTAFIQSIYIVADKYNLKKAVLKALYQTFKEKDVQFICKVGKMFNKQATNFIVGKILDQIIVGFLIFLVMYAIGLPYPALIQTVMGVMNIIPVFGPFMGAIPGTLIIFLESPIKALWFIILIVIMQQIDANIIEVRILGQTQNISPFWILFQLAVGSSIAGIAGMILGIPVFLVIQTLLTEYQNRVLLERGLEGVVEQNHSFYSGR